MKLRKFEAQAKDGLFPTQDGVTIFFALSALILFKRTIRA